VEAIVVCCRPFGDFEMHEISSLALSVFFFREVIIQPAEIPDLALRCEGIEPKNEEGRQQFIDGSALGGRLPE